MPGAATPLTISTATAAAEFGYQVSSLLFCRFAAFNLFSDDILLAS